MQINHPQAHPILGPWQKKQAAMLYHYSSVEYLTPLYRLISSFINNFADPTLDAAKIQGRDALVTDEKWGDRNTSNNWSNNAWPFLKELQTSLARDIATRQSGEYSITKVNECLRGIAEYSTEWATQQERQLFREGLAAISLYSLPHDKTVFEYHNRWDDATFAHYFPIFLLKNPAIPKFKVRLDITATTGEVPPETGAYIAHGDPHATLQFVWKEGRGAKLRKANTFNEIGLAALKQVGRDDLWLSDEKMFKFAMQEKYSDKFRATLTYAGSEWPSAASATVAAEAFSSVPRKWSLVERIPDETEMLEDLSPSEYREEIPFRVEGGAVCVKSGYYFTPSANRGPQYFCRDDIFPKLQSDYGESYWQWERSQK